MKKFGMPQPELGGPKPQDSKEAGGTPETGNNISELKLTGDSEQVLKLEKKLKEYRRRHEDGKYLAPEMKDQDSELNEKYKRTILQTLLEDGEVDIEALRGKMQADGDYDARTFESALRIIDGYNRNDLKHLRGGTGLK